MPKKEYDKILYRLIHILSRLNSGERLHLKTIADEFGVGVRTLQKDFNERLIMFPIQSDRSGYYWFERGYSLKENQLETEEMLIVILSLMPLHESPHLGQIGQNVIKKLFSRRIPNPFYIKTEGMEDIDIDSHLINTLEDAINGQWIVRIETREKSFTVEPYRIVNYDGIWYLFARDTDTGTLKTWLISKIRSINSLDHRHDTPIHQIDQMLEKTHTAWFEEGGDFEVVVEIDPSIAHYFELKKFLNSQEIIEKKDDGKLIVSFDVTSDEDVDNLIKAWLPHIKILSPEWLRTKIRDELKEYLSTLEE
ncbi:MAG: WYL domain-containing protein [Sulfuricurvum sp.]|jgi:predicted DNA-binding transcriptional regulator YafY